MIGSSVVTGLPNRWVMPSSFKSARKAERPVMRFFMFPPARRRFQKPSCYRMMIKVDGAMQGRVLMAALHGDNRRRSKHAVAIPTFPRLRALPDDAWKALQRHQLLAGIGPFLQLFDRHVIERLPAGTAGKKRARNVDHVWRSRARVEERRAAIFAEAARGLRRPVLEMRDVRFPAHNTEALAPASDIGRVGRAMGLPA